jgi:hypothetical protein
MVRQLASAAAAAEQQSRRRAWASLADCFGIIVRAADAGWRLVEDDRVAIGLNYSDHAAESGMPVPKEPEIADLADARADARRAAHERQLVDVDLAQLGKPLRRKHVAGDVRDDFRQIADAALGVEHAGLFPTGCTEADEFDKNSPCYPR